MIIQHGCNNDRDSLKTDVVCDALDQPWAINVSTYAVNYGQKHRKALELLSRQLDVINHVGPLRMRLSELVRLAH